MEKIHLLLIDPQNDFMDIPGAALSVPGANEDMKRVAALIDRLGERLADIHVTLDSHHPVDVSHPGFWRKADGSDVGPFTQISLAKIDAGEFSPRDPRCLPDVRAYVETLEKSDRYELTVWPEHCLIGSWGHNVQADVFAALNRWARRKLNLVDYVTKGSNPWTEHYSAVRAEVPDPRDPSTTLNRRLIDTLEQADVILVAGEALSHCVANTVRDIVANFGAESVSKIVLLEDCSSSVISPFVDFPAVASRFVADMKALGMRVAKSDEVFSSL